VFTRLLLFAVYRCIDFRTFVVLFLMMMFIVIVDDVFIIVDIVILIHSFVMVLLGTLFLFVV